MISRVFSNDVVTKYGNKFLNSKALKKLCSERAGDAAATIALLSTTTKDLVNCIYYTKQSLDNEKIPEEKRKFVAAIDLANGFLNVTTQLTLGMYIKNKAPALFDFIVKKFGTKLAPDALGLAKNGFNILTTLVFAQIILKRVLTPFAATPIAHYLKEYAEKKAVKTQGIDKTPANLDNKLQDKNQEPSPALMQVPSKSFTSFEKMLNTNK
ncbi:MAG: hypothetical protein KHX03_07785 [Clostridium sp.]|nr:hypothetical protein [Clostridium sp.]